MYVLAIDLAGPLEVDVRSLGITSATATVHEYSATQKDEVVATLAVVDGRVTAPTPARGVSVIEIQ